MRPFVASSSAIEVNGETVRAFLEGTGGSRARAARVLESRGLGDPKPGTWYSQQKWLDAFKEIADTVGPNTLFLIGKAIPANAKFPPQISTIEQGLAAIDMAYKMNHRGGEIGSYRFQPTGPRSAAMVCDNPYPSDFDRGIILAVAERFKPDGGFVAVRLDEGKPSRKTGGESCTFLVTW
jgi:hypothetical protein